MTTEDLSMNEPALHRRNFLLHLQERSGCDGPVLLKEPAREQPSGSHLDQLHNEFAITRYLTGAVGVRPALAKEGTESRPVLLLEYVDGYSLAELIRSDSLDLAEKLRLALNVTRALGHVHDHQVMHKDVSSGNILVDGGDSPGSQGGVYLIDFGLASTTGKESPSFLAADDTLVGALAYISPEQTGRVNREVDYRTDLYSLGVVLYELFTGRLPFGDGVALEMIHSHIARQPQPPHEADVGVPRPVSDIIQKLLSKGAEDRYQTTDGLAADLESCLSQWQTKGRIEPFELGADDFTGRLQIPQQVYGREAEIQQLSGILDRAVTGTAQLALVAGFSGVGKTSLVREIHKDVLVKRAIFVEGKFDQLGKTLPYSAWGQALTQLVNTWLAGSEADLARWRDTILAAVGDWGQILVDVIPALERIIGPQPEVPQLGGLESQNRFNEVFNRFVSSLTAPEHPLVVFLDDLQWIDPASLNLIEVLLAVQARSSFLVIGAYRSNEVGADHPLAIAQDRLDARSDGVTVISLGELEPADTHRMLADTLQLSEASCRDLGQLLLEKTAGNPFYYRQFLHALELDGFLRFDRAERRWTWERELPQGLQAGSNVAELMLNRLHTLPDHTREPLSMAACIGSRFNGVTLATILGRPQADILTDLAPALDRGLLVRSDGHYLFSHDRVQEAAYALIPGSDRPPTHLRIGRLLLARAATDPSADQMFNIVGHLNLGRGSIETASERLELAELNLAAGRKAKAAAAFLDAQDLIETALDLLPRNSWQEQYELTLSLYNELGELAALNGQFEQLETSASQIHANAKNILDRVPIYTTTIEAEISRYNVSQALDIGLEVLSTLDAELPIRPTAQDYRRLNDRIVNLIEDKPPEAIVELPEMSDPSALAASSILTSIISAAYIANPKLFPIIAYRGAILTLESGRNVWSPFFLGLVAEAASAGIGLDTPHEEGLASLSLCKRMQLSAHRMQKDPTTARSRTQTLQSLAISMPWTGPIDRAVEMSQRTLESGEVTGAYLYAGYGVIHYMYQTFCAGVNLRTFTSRMTGFMQLLQRMGQKMSLQWVAMFLQTAHRFAIVSADPQKLSGSYFDEDEWLPAAVSAGDMTGRAWFYINKLMLSYHFDLDDLLDGYRSEAESCLGGIGAMLYRAIFSFYDCLCRLRSFPDLEQENQTDAMRIVDASLRLMRIWSEGAPSTFQHRFDLIAAEKARVAGDTDDAISHYERAIDHARKSGFTHEEALANELYSRFWAEHGRERFAAPLMREAHSLYQKWGASGKAEHLTQRYPDWLISHDSVVNEPATVTTSGVIPGDLDLLTVLKASQNIASELDLDRLLAKLMADLIENSGAQQGYLILEDDDQWVISAEASVGDPAPIRRAAKSIDESNELAQRIVQYVARTQELVELEDASRSGDFVHDPYVQAHEARSILCMPLINQGRISAILYLQNNLASGVFSPQRVALLKLLSSQMAISVDNARVNDQLERLLESRSKALVSAEAQIRTLFEGSPLGIALSTYEGKVLSANQALLKMLRISEEELLQHSVTDFYADSSDRDVLLKRVEELGFLQDFGVQVARHDGSTFHASLNISRIVLGGNEVLLAMVEDVTAQITAEQETATLEERARLARELHDAVTQTLVSASLLADATASGSEEGRATATRDLVKLKELLRGALDEMRTLLLEMRPVAKRDLTLGQLLAPLAEAGRARSRAKVNLRIEGDRVLPENVTATLQRIAQESLNNATRHAEAEAVNVDLVCDPDGVELRITDDGRGFDVERIPAGHHGLSIMRERAREIGAVLEVHSTIDGGTEVFVTWS